MYKTVRKQSGEVNCKNLSKMAYVAAVNLVFILAVLAIPSPVFNNASPGNVFFFLFVVHIFGILGRIHIIVIIRHRFTEPIATLQHSC